jgi:hypothetical protein
MTDEMMSLQALIEKSPDADLLRICGPAPHGAGSQGLTGGPTARRPPRTSPSATAIAIEPGRKALRGQLANGFAPA